MHNIIYDMVSIFTASAIFALTFLFLYKVENSKYLLYWSLSWALFSFAIIIRILHKLDIDIPLAPQMHLTFNYFSNMCLLFGALQFVYNRKKKNLAILFFIGWLVIMLAYQLTANHDSVSFVIFLLSMAVFIYTGTILYIHTRKFSLGGRIAGITLILWGLHKADYPFLHNIEWFAPLGYQIAVVFTLITAVGIILMHFEKTKKDIVKREILFQHLAEASKDIVFTVNFVPKFELSYISKSIESITGYTPEEVMTNLDIANNIILDFVEWHIGTSNIYAKVDSDHNKHEIITKHGSRAILEFTCTDYFNLDGSIDRVVGFARNVTDRVLAFDNLIDRQDWYESIFQKSNIAKMLINAETGIITDGNKAMLGLCGYGIGELRTTHVDQLFLSEVDADIFWQKSEKNIQSERFKIKDKLGITKNVLISTFSLNFAKTRYLYINFTDITSEIYFETELKNITTLHSAILESVNEGVIGIHNNGVIFFVNSFALEMLGYETDELTGKDHHSSIHYKSDDGELHLEDCAIMNAIKNSKAINNYRDFFVTKEGNLVPVDVTIGQFQYFNSEPQSIIVFRNISEELENERKMLQQIDENRVLLHEVHHRVKNNLQIICSLLSLQANTLTSDNDVSKLTDSISRIRSMSLIHELLYQSKQLSSIKINIYIERLLVDLLSILTNHEDISLDMDLDDVSINLDIAVPCGLIITELFTNAIKHAFKDKQEDCIISVSFKQKNNINTIIVKDSGSGLKSLDDIHQSKSLGMTIINSLTKQIGGQIEYKNDNGLTVELKFKAVR